MIGLATFVVLHGILLKPLLASPSTVAATPRTESLDFDMKRKVLTEDLPSTQHYGYKYYSMTPSPTSDHHALFKLRRYCYSFLDKAITLQASL